MRAMLGRITLAAMLFSFCAAGIGAVRAAEQAPLMAAVVDVQRVLREATASNQARDAIEARRTSYERDLATQKAKLQEAQDQLQKQRAVLTPQAMEQRRQEIDQQLNDLRRQTEERRATLQEATNNVMNQLRKEMGGAIAEVMKSKGVELTLPRSAVLVFDNRLDITNDVLETLNKRLPKVDVPLN
jgi:outer membrane protein